MVRKWIWASIAISSMWVAVLFASVLGGDIVIDDAMDHIVLPIGVPVAMFAFLATIVVAALGFRSDREVEVRGDREERRLDQRAPVAGTSA